VIKIEEEKITKKSAAYIAFGSEKRVLIYSVCGGFFGLLTHVATRFNFLMGTYVAIAAFAVCFVGAATSFMKMRYYENEYDLRIKRSVKYERD